jgi:ABC-2 type transport system ATP-binding protein
MMGADVAAPMVQVTGLSKYYGPYVGIEDVTFSISRGEVVGFLGPNGAGKTTTMRILTCSMPASDGQARVAGYDVLRDSVEVRKRVGYLPEAPPLYPEMTVDGYLRFVADIKRVRRDEKPARLDYVLEVCALGHMRRRILGQLSKGYRQRVGIAQALIHDPDVLIFDEPTSGLDPQQIVEIRQLIRELGKERTVILSTHILPEASMTCRRLLIVNEGRLVGNVRLDENGEPSSIAAGDGAAVEYGKARTVRVVVRGAPEGLDGKLRALPGVEETASEVGTDGNTAWTLATSTAVDVRPALAATVLHAGADLLELREMRPSLEQVFLDLTVRAPHPAPPYREEPPCDEEPRP